MLGGGGGDGGDHLILYFFEQNTISGHVSHFILLALPLFFQAMHRAAGPEL